VAPCVSKKHEKNAFFALRFFPDACSLPAHGPVKGPETNTSGKNRDWFASWWSAMSPEHRQTSAFLRGINASPAFPPEQQQR